MTTNILILASFVTIGHICSEVSLQLSLGKFVRNVFTIFYYSQYFCQIYFLGAANLILVMNLEFPFRRDGKRDCLLEAVSLNQSVDMAIYIQRKLHVVSCIRFMNIEPFRRLPLGCM